MKPVSIVLLWSLILVTCIQADPVTVHPDNPHYFLLDGEPALLMGSTEHYGALLNLDFDYHPYFDELQACGLNLTRTFTGVYCEHSEAFGITKNTLAPAPGKLICPWARSTQPGYQNGGNKFDLTTWDENYFNRLHDFVSQAEKRGVVVELVLFCTYYGDEQWELSPLNSINNINGIGDVSREDVLTLRHEPLTLVQDAMVRKIVTELNEHDNLFYEICNEPYFGVPMEWERHIIDLIVEVEATLPKQHLIAQNIANNASKIEHPHPAVSLFNFHYATSPAVDLNYHLNRPLGDDETGFEGTENEPYRTEAWNFILSGGALFDHLDYSFTVDHEDGTYDFPATQPGGGGKTLRREFQILHNFITTFDLVRMKPFQAALVGGVPDNMNGRILADPANAYACYFYEKGDQLTNMSLRWTTMLTPPASGLYTFFATTDDGVRFFVDDSLLFVDWSSHAAREYSGSIQLTAGTPVRIVMEYYQGMGGARADLKWSGPDIAKTDIPLANLVVPDGKEAGWKLEWFDDTELRQFKAETIVPKVVFDGSLDDRFPKSDADNMLMPEIDLPSGAYTISWLNTKSGEKTESQNIEHPGGTLTLTAPEFDADIALMIRLSN